MTLTAEGYPGDRAFPALRATGRMRSIRVHGSARPDFRVITAVAYTLFALQLAGCLWWSWTLYQRSSLTYDFAVYHQAYYLIGHGDLNPFSSVLGRPFWRNDGELVLWPLALFGMLSNSAFLLLLLQDVCVVLTGVVAFNWVRQLATSPSWRSSLSPELALGLALIFLLANPWVYWTTSYDFHVEPLVGLLLILATRALYRRRWPLLGLLVTALLLCGASAVVLVIGLGITGLLGGRSRRVAALGVLAAGTAWLALITGLGGATGAGVTTYYAYLAGGVHPAGGTMRFALAILEHPQRVLVALDSVRLQVLELISGAGAIGILCRWTAGPIILSLLAADLYGNAHSRPFVQTGFQNFPIFALLVVGLVFVFEFLAAAGPVARILSGVLGAVLVVNLILLCHAQFQYIRTTWLSVSPASAATLRHVERLIPSNAEVVVSQGVAGAFSARRWIYPIVSEGTVPASVPDVYFIICPGVGVQTMPLRQQKADVTTLREHRGVKLISHANDVWVFHWRTHPTARLLLLPRTADTMRSQSVTTQPITTQIRSSAPLYG